MTEFAGVLKPGKEPHACIGCSCNCSCCVVGCGWDCGCPSYYKPEEIPDDQAN